MEEHFSIFFHQDIIKCGLYQQTDITLVKNPIDIINSGKEHIQTNDHFLHSPGPFN